MNINNLDKSIPYRPTKHQSRAFEMLENKGFNRSVIIRNAIDEYMYKEFRTLLKLNKSNNNIPDWA